MLDIAYPQLYMTIQQVGSGNFRGTHPKPTKEDYCKINSVPSEN